MYLVTTAIPGRDNGGIPPEKFVLKKMVRRKCILQRLLRCNPSSLPILPRTHTPPTPSAAQFAGGAETIAQLTNEVALMTRLSHPNIVKVRWEIDKGYLLL